MKRKCERHLFTLEEKYKAFKYIDEFYRDISQTKQAKVLSEFFNEYEPIGRSTWKNWVEKKDEIIEQVEAEKNNKSKNKSKMSLRNKNSLKKKFHVLV